jgi:Zn-dependent M28 family amino/carboxypeptidase
MRLRSLLVVLLALAACDGNSKPAADRAAGKIWEEFSGENALRHVQQLVDYGPRTPGSEAIEQARNHITKELEAIGWKVTRQSFTDDTPQGKMTFVNLIGTFSGSESQKTAPSFLLCSHYDTKLFYSVRFVGANDGGSSNGLLIEMARVLATQPTTAAQVQLVFFDGEEAYVNFTETDGLYGSRYFAKQLQAESKVKQFRGGILFDMVGDKSLTITLSPDSPPGLPKGIFAAAETLNVRQHFTYAAGAIMDDHTPLNAIGIPVIDLIDFDFPAWHTAGDTMETISAESMRIVASVALRYLADEALK